MAYTTADLAALEAAIAIGALTVKFGDREVTYRSLDEMMKIRSVIKNELAGGGQTYSTLATFVKD